MIKFNLDGANITANPTFCKAIGYALSDIKGRHHRMFAELAYGSSGQHQHLWENLHRCEFQAAEYKRVGSGERRRSETRFRSREGGS